MKVRSPINRYEKELTPGTYDIIKGKWYEVLSINLNNGMFEIEDEDGDRIVCRFERCPHLNGYPHETANVYNWETDHMVYSKNLKRILQ